MLELHDARDFAPVPYKLPHAHAHARQAAAWRVVALAMTGLAALVLLMRSSAWWRVCAQL